MEILHHFLLFAENMNLVKGILVGENFSISHLQFADDTICFFETFTTAAKNLKNLLLCFELVFDLKVNFHNSCHYSFNQQPNMVASVADALGCRVGRPPFKYMGILFGSYIKRMTIWEHIIAKFKSMLPSWKNK
ncbi:hypothetical protein REPUB_Repub14bG0089200 [Reevesia pubescens]